MKIVHISDLHIGKDRKAVELKKIGFSVKPLLHFKPQNLRYER